MENQKKFNIGLDIGVASVGWCITDEKGELIKKNGKNLWGSSLFNEACTAQSTRLFRGARRRLERRKQRINILQSLLIEDIEKEYPNFIPMLRETSLTKEEKFLSKEIRGRKYNLFCESNMTDENYYKKYPTIYHLRNELANSKEKADIRLVYLAISHIIKYRGNFLYDGDFENNTENITEQLDIIIRFLENEYDIVLKSDNSKIINILEKDNITRTKRKEEIGSLFDYDKSSKKILENTIKALLGVKFELDKIFEIEEIKISFSEEIKEEEQIVNKVGNNAEIYYALKNIYSWYTLQDILKGNQYISEAFIKKYNKYSEDLKLLKKIYKEYFPNEYDNMFRKNGEKNYVAYTGKACKKCKQNEFLEVLKKQIDKLPETCENKKKILNEISEETFLKKLNVTDNGAIPNQLHKKELDRILENQAPYYKTIKDEKENILKLFSFRIPYYVGPLAKTKGKWAWIVRKNNDKITPLNFEEVVDTDKTAEEFIRRMTNKCTYIYGEDVIPKQSLLYSKFCVLNELNNIRYNKNKSLAKDTKKKIIENLFKRKKKVTLKNVKDLLEKENILVENISGVSDGESFNSSMSSYIDMERIFKKVEESNVDKYEEIIYWITIFEDKKILERKILEKYKDVTKEQIKELLKLKYTGWARLSKKLLIGLKDYNGDNIIDKLENTNLNFMQIINQKEFAFYKELQELMPSVSKNINYKDIEEIPTSPANKRAIWKAICIVKELCKVMSSEPENIYVEFARNEEEKKMKDSRAKKLLKIYNDIQWQSEYFIENDKEIRKQVSSLKNEKLNERLYLYYLQMGKCLYSGKKLNITDLDKYEVDHIIPRSYRKDDSLENKALVLKEENQRKEDSLLLSEKIINKQQKWWEFLLKNDLMSQSKYNRLIRRKMFETNEDREKFINRQLVETRQITKYVTNLLKSKYENTQIFAIRAELTHNFRDKIEIYKNRNINDCHHAQDSYILSVIGNIINKKWNNNEFRYGEYVKKYMQKEKSKHEKHGIVMGLVFKNIDISKVKKTLTYKDYFISRMLEEKTGEFYNQNILKASDKKLIPIKTGKDTQKYGGYSNENKAYCVLFSYKNEKDQTKYQMMGVPIKIAYDIKNKKESLQNYIETIILSDVKFKNVNVLKEKILINQEYLDKNNEPMKLCSDVEIRPCKQLIVNEEISKLIYYLNSESKFDTKEIINEQYEYLYEYLLNKIKNEYKIFLSIYLKLNDKKDDFLKLENETKKRVINGILELMKTGQGNLKDIGLSDRAGRKGGQNFNTEKLLTMTFVDKSVTGIYERRFKINGVEDNSSK